MKNSDDTERIDIKYEFFEKCSGIEIGKIVAMPTFKLAEAMSSIELMDPKMDTGMKRMTQGMGIEKAIAEGLLKGDSAEVLATMDATFALLVSWLEGGNLAQTVWTNVMLKHLTEFQHTIYTPFCHAITHMVQLVTFVICNSYTFEEEDFQQHAPVLVNSKIPREKVVAQLREVIATVSHTASVSYNRKSDESKLLLAIGTRLELCALFIECITWLVPPQSPNALKVLSIYNKGGDEEDSSETVDRGIVPRLLSEVEEDENQPPFTRSESNYQQCRMMTRRLTNVAEAMAETVNMGRKAPEGQTDGNFDWLTAIEPNLNKRLLPPTFPRKVEIPDRPNALHYIVLMTRRLNIIAEHALDSARDLTELFFFARSFNIDGSCVLTRSVLQLAMFPLDEHISGDPKKSIVTPMEVTMREKFPPLVMDKSSLVHHDHMARQLFEAFKSQMSKLTLSVYQNFGTNLARQRDRIIVSIEDLGLIQRDANRVEFRTAEIVRENSVEAPHQAVATFVLYNLLSLVTHYFELSLRMDLFVPYEFPYIYWYMGDILARWQISTVERSQDMCVYAWRQNPLSTTVNKRMSRDRQRGEEQMRINANKDQCHLILQFAMSLIAEGVVKMTIALIKLGKIKVPKWADDSEQLRYESRMAPMKCLGYPLYIPYEQYLVLSKVQEVHMLPTAQIIEESIEKFELSIHQIQKLSDYPNYRTDQSIYLMIARSNLIAAKLLLKLKEDIHKRRVEWSFNERCLIYPILKIT